MQFSFNRIWFFFKIKLKEQNDRKKIFPLLRLSSIKMAKKIRFLKNINSLNMVNGISEIVGDNIFVISNNNLSMMKI